MTLDRDSEQQQWPQGLWVSGVRGPSSRWPKVAAPVVCVDPPHAGPRPQHQRCAWTLLTLAQGRSTS